MQKREEIPPRANLKRRVYLKALGAVAVSAASIGLLFSFGDYRVYMAYLSGADYWKLWPLAIISPLAQILRSYRLGLLLGPTPAFFDRQLYQMSSLYMLLSAVLPMRTGEFALPVLLKLRRGVSLSIGAGFVLVMRVFDLAMVLILCGIVAAVALPHPSWRLLGLGGALGALFGLFILPAGAEWVRQWASRAGVRGGKIWKVVEGLAEGAAVLRTRRRWLLAWSTTLLIWLAVFVSYYVSSETITHLPVTVVVLAGGAASFAVAQPVNGIAGLGVVQAAWAGTAYYLGIDWHAAVATGVVIHVAQLAASMFNAGLAQIAVRLAPVKIGPVANTE